MTIGIYAIRNIFDDKRYVGKSINIQQRFWTHRNKLSADKRDERQTNRHLWNAVSKYGIDAFEFEILEIFESVDENLIAEREFHWMDHFKSCDRRYGYNLRRDSSTKMEVHVETRLINSVFNMGSGNPNFGKTWSDAQRYKMGETVKSRHKNLDIYGEEWKSKLSEASKKAWACPEKRKAMGEKVSIKRQRYKYQQYDRSGVKLLRTWDNIKQIVAENPDYKWQNIYNVCHGHKPSYMGFVWKQIPKGAVNADEI